jgi:hypothetical protein
MKRWAVPGIPFVLSLCLSLSTVGAHPYWQDSGLYLTAIHEWGVLYAPGFVLYEVLCRLWTQLLFFVDFTLAVHLFSSVCAALACGALALSTRDLLGSRGKLFTGLPRESVERAGACGILAGILMAGGFTFWSTAITAKGYTFYYLILASLLWRMIRADESGKPRDFSIVAALIGFAWQAHPSAVLLGPVLIAFVAVHAKSLGAKAVAVRVALSAACALGPSLLILPILISRDPWLMFGRPDGVGSILRYVLGVHFAGIPGAFGLDASRALSFVRYLWEDHLGVGLLLSALGFRLLARANRRLFWGFLLWIVPYSVFTILFKPEGQHDCWLVAARLPLTLAAGLGVGKALWGRPEGKPWDLRIVGGVATLWAVLVNYPDLNQRNYTLAEDYGRILIGTADPNAIVLLSGDDSNGLAAYLQRVKRERTDLTLVTSSFLDSEATTGSDWYDASLRQRNPTLKHPDYRALRARFPGLEIKQTAVAAFINANAGGYRPVLTEFAVRPELLRPDLQVVPAGVHWKILRADSEALIEDRYWKFPVQPEEVRPRYRRARGQEVTYAADGVRVKPQVYERRLLAQLLRARQRQAMVFFQQERFADAARVCQSIVDVDDEEFNSNPEFVHLLGISYYGAGRMDRAEPVLRLSAQISTRKENQATALFYLGDLARRRGDAETAKRYVDQARSIPGLDENVRRKLESPQGPK